MMQRAAIERPPRLELWGGIECTVARVGDAYRDQCEETGHFSRPDDLEMVAALGIRTLRYPVLWEHVAPVSPDRTEWRRSDASLGALRRLGVAPIVGLLHHGSGPRYTNLLDPAFPDLLAGHAEHVARRYPWVERFTPVNEPLTTARFSALYGVWFPHGRTDAAFLRALVNQCAAVVRSMQAIRRVNPTAQLVQTEDLGKTFSTGALRYQADFENDRRWLSLDLLCGRVDREHPLYRRLLLDGITEHELARFRERPCPPDIIGINHYLTSERFLDQDLASYPAQFHGGNERQRYADVEAVRMDLPDEATGPEARLRETWARYGRPIAVTEAHHGSTREEQLRWLAQVWEAATVLRHEGPDIRAVAIWSLFGAVDWNSLLINRAGFYEPGPYDVRSKPPRPTALARAAVRLAGDGRLDHPVLDRPGWWRRDGRHYHPPNHHLPRAPERVPRTLLITGADGRLGRVLSRACVERGLDHTAHTLNPGKSEPVVSMIERTRPWAVIHAPEFSRGADGGRERASCLRGAAEDAVDLARACAEHGVKLVTFSSDAVFNGAAVRPYVESDAICPGGPDGASEAEAERRALAAAAGTLVVRSTALFGPDDPDDIACRILRALAAARPLRVSASETVSPTYVPDLVRNTLDLLIDDERGVWHLASAGAVTWYEFARELAQAANLDLACLIPIEHEPRNRALGSVRGHLMPSLHDCIARLVLEPEVAALPDLGSKLAPLHHQTLLGPSPLQKALKPPAVLSPAPPNRPSE